MSNFQFNKILIMARHRADHLDLNTTVKSLYSFLYENNLDIYFEKTTAKNIPNVSKNTIDFCNIDNSFDLIIVVGGDGNLIQAAKDASNYNIPVVGINRGYLGFLTDICPDSFESEIMEILNGNFILEKRSLLEAYSSENKKQHTALNDVVLLPGSNSSHMIEFTIYADDHIICHQRADGLITSTPTGSTAYALSGGGPILYPSLDAIVLVPMFPHTLSSRPIVLDAKMSIRIGIDNHMQNMPCFSCDGHERIAITPGESLIITKSKNIFTLLHPTTYNYFKTLRNKLGWESKHT